MRLFAPIYYQRFACVADKCRHSCCIGWEIDIDEQTLAGYRTLEGELGEAVRASITEGEDGAFFALRPDGRCPHLDERGLCEIIKSAGEASLCEICREHPRFYNTVCGRIECGLGAVCEEAARLILAEDDYLTLLPLDGEGGEPIPTQRDALLARLHDATRPYRVRRAELEAQYCPSLATLPEGELAALLGSLEYLDGAHRERLLKCLAPAEASEEAAPLCERVLAYLLYRHALPDAAPADLAGAVGFALLLERLFCRLVCQEGGDPIEAAVMLSEELEYSQDNTDAIRFFFEAKSPDTV